MRAMSSGDSDMWQQQQQQIRRMNRLTTTETTRPLYESTVNQPSAATETQHRESVILTARRCDSVVYAVVVCLSICLSQTRMVLKRLD